MKEKSLPSCQTYAQTGPSGGVTEAATGGAVGAFHFSSGKQTPHPACVHTAVLAVCTHCTAVRRVPP